ncbi:MAG TPA: VOC family protein [Candidatus Cybelea sp.]|jgi:catechol 2,3-dioxygenase-like lactoylglutathione lyase family enzyme
MTRPPFAIEAIDHILLLVDGMERSLAFYEGVLGASVKSRLPQYAMAELRAGTSHLDLVDTASPEGRWAGPAHNTGRNVEHVALRLGPCAEGALRKHLAGSGVAIVEEREENGLSGRRLSLYVRDPSGNQIELILGGSEL